MRPERFWPTKIGSRLNARNHVSSICVLDHSSVKLIHPEFISYSTFPATSEMFLPSSCLLPRVDQNRKSKRKKGLTSWQKPSHACRSAFSPV